MEKSKTLIITYLEKFKDEYKKLKESDIYKNYEVECKMCIDFMIMLKEANEVKLHNQYKFFKIYCNSVFYHNVEANSLLEQMLKPLKEFFINGRLYDTMYETVFLEHYSDDNGKDTMINYYLDQIRYYKKDLCNILERNMLEHDSIKLVNNILNESNITTNEVMCILEQFDKIGENIDDDIFNDYYHKEVAIYNKFLSETRKDKLLSELMDIDNLYRGAYIITFSLFKGLTRIHKIFATKYILDKLYNLDNNFTIEHDNFNLLYNGNNINKIKKYQTILNNYGEYGNE